MGPIFKKKQIRDIILHKKKKIRKKIRDYCGFFNSEIYVYNT